MYSSNYTFSTNFPLILMEEYLTSSESRNQMTCPKFKYMIHLESNDGPNIDYFYALFDLV